MWQLITAMTIWGTLGLVVLKSGLGSVEIAFFRCLIGIVLLAPYCWYKGFFRTSIFTLKTVSMVLLGGIFVVINWILLFQSFKLASITLGNVSYYVQPVFLVILARILFKEEVSLLKWICILLTLCGVLLAMNLSISSLHVDKRELIGVICALAAGLFYSFATIIAKDIKGVTPAVMTLFQLLIGTVILVPFIKMADLQFTSIALFYILILGIVHTMLAFVLYYQSVRKLPTTTIAAISYIDPIVAVLTDVLFFGRTLGLIQILGIILTLASSYFVVNPEALRKIFLIKKTINE